MVFEKFFCPRFRVMMGENHSAVPLPNGQKEEILVKPVLSGGMPEPDGCRCTKGCWAIVSCHDVRDLSGQVIQFNRNPPPGACRPASLQPGSNG